MKRCQERDATHQHLGESRCVLHTMLFVRQTLSGIDLFHNVLY